MACNTFPLTCYQCPRVARFPRPNQRQCKRACNTALTACLHRQCPLKACRYLTPSTLASCPWPTSTHRAPSFCHTKCSRRTLRKLAQDRTPRTQSLGVRRNRTHHRPRCLRREAQRTPHRRAHPRRLPRQGGTLRGIAPVGFTGRAPAVVAGSIRVEASESGTDPGKVLPSTHRALTCPSRGATSSSPHLIRKCRLRVLETQSTKHPSRQGGRAPHRPTQKTCPGRSRLRRARSSRGPLAPPQGLSQGVVGGWTIALTCPCSPY